MLIGYGNRRTNQSPCHISCNEHVLKIHPFFLCVNPIFEAIFLLGFSRLKMKKNNNDMNNKKQLPQFETETEENCDFKKFDFTKLHDYTHEDYKWFLKIVASISVVLCIHQYESTEWLYKRAFGGEEHLPDNAIDIFVMAIHFCRKHGIIGNITPEQIAFQVNSLTYPIKSDKEIREAINHY